MKSLLLLASTIFPALLMAHPGHGETEGFSFLHYLTEPMHALITLGAIVAVYAGIRYFRSKKENT